MKNTRYFIGKEGFVWWVGVVEDRMDPEQLGRVRVRCFGWHTDDKVLIPTDALPWARPVLPVNVPSSYTLKEGDWCVGFFMDGESAQEPVVLGSLTGAPKEAAKRELGFHDPSGTYPKRLNESTLNRPSRGRLDGTANETRKRAQVTGIPVAGGSTWNEPSPSFSPQYPFNFAIESESGHAIELDDTKGKERVHISHNNGSAIEFDSAGNRVDKIVRNGYTVVCGDDYVYVAGDCNITVDGDLNLKVGGTFNVEADHIKMASNSFKALGGDSMKLESFGKMDVKGGEESNFGGGDTAIAGSDVVIQGASVDVVAAMIDLQSSSTTSGASGAGLDLPKAASGTVNKSTSMANNVASSYTGGTTGKGGITSSVSGVYTGTLSNISTGMTQLKSQMPKDQLVAAMNGLESNLNGVAGQVANLPSSQIAEIQSKTGELVTAAGEKGIALNVTESMLPPVPEVVTVTGKRLYPKTETITKG